MRASVASLKFVAVRFSICSDARRRKADPSTPLRSGRDDTFYEANDRLGTLGTVSKTGDRIATRGMSTDPDKQQIPPLRCAPVGMTPPSGSDR